MNQWGEVLATAFIATVGSSGLWAYILHRSKKHSQTDRLLQGLAYDRIISMGMDYISRGWITNDEYDDFRRFLYDPYKALGGNGVTERIMAEVSSLPLRQRAKYSEIIREAKTRGQQNDGASVDEYAEAA